MSSSKSRQKTLLLKCFSSTHAPLCTTEPGNGASPTSAPHTPAASAGTAPSPPHPSLRSAHPQTPPRGHAASMGTPPPPAWGLAPPASLLPRSLLPRSLPHKMAAALGRLLRSAVSARPPGSPPLSAPCRLPLTPCLSPHRCPPPGGGCRAGPSSSPTASSAWVSAGHTPRDPPPGLGVPAASSPPPWFSVPSGASRLAPAVTQHAPFFKGTAVVHGEFKELSLDDFKGKYLVLFFYPLDL